MPQFSCCYFPTQPEGNFSPSSSSLLGHFSFNHLHIRFRKLVLSLQAQKPSLPPLVLWDAIGTHSIPGSSLLSTSTTQANSTTSRTPWCSFVFILFCFFLFMRTKDELVFLSHPRTHSERTMPWWDEVQAPRGYHRGGGRPAGSRGHGQKHHHVPCY